MTNLPEILRVVNFRERFCMSDRDNVIGQIFDPSTGVARSITYPTQAEIEALKLCFQNGIQKPPLLEIQCFPGGDIARFAYFQGQLCYLFRHNPIQILMQAKSRVGTDCALKRLPTELYPMLANCLKDGTRFNDNVDDLKKFKINKMDFPTFNIEGWDRLGRFSRRVRVQMDGFGFIIDKVDIEKRYWTLALATVNRVHVAFPTFYF
jgi:hypothetical protein